MKLNHAVVSLFLVLGLSACKTVETPDGKIPAEYLETAKTLAGTYKGEFNRVSGEISLAFDGATPVVTYTDASGHDLLGPGCGSEIGTLTQIDVSMDEKLGEAVFAFSPGKCQIEGRSVYLGIKQKSDGILVYVKIIKGHRMEHTPGDTSCNMDGHGQMHCVHFPGSWVKVDDYISGKFEKKN
ncbi:MAG: hypothetical protein ACJ763_01875 [Bdellovibrionia bacterium]